MNEETTKNIIELPFEQERLVKEIDHLQRVRITHLEKANLATVNKELAVYHRLSSPVVFEEEVKKGHAVSVEHCEREVKTNNKIVEICTRLIDEKSEALKELQK